MNYRVITRSEGTCEKNLLLDLRISSLTIVMKMCQFAQYSANYLCHWRWNRLTRSARTRLWLSSALPVTANKKGITSMHCDIVVNLRKLIPDCKTSISYWLNWNWYNSWTSQYKPVLESAVEGSNGELADVGCEFVNPRLDTKSFFQCYKHRNVSRDLRANENSVITRPDYGRTTFMLTRELCVEKWWRV